MKDININITNYLIPETKIYSGRDKGIEVRKKIKLDTKDKEEIVYNIFIDPKTIMISSSFILGLFKDSYLKYGSKIFDQKYIFITKTLTHPDEIKEDIQRGIDYLRKYGNKVL